MDVAAIPHPQLMPANATSPDLPQFESGKTYVLKGETLNRIMDAIRAAQIIQVEGAKIERTPQGVIIKIG